MSENIDAKRDGDLNELIDPKVSIRGYIALLLGILIFSGLLKDAGVFSFLDYGTLLGKFGKIGEIESIRGTGGVGAREGMLFAFTVMPALALAIGLISVIEGQGGLNAAQKLLTPLLRPLLGVPGWTGLSLIANLQQTDSGSALARDIFDRNLLTESEKVIYISFLFSNPGMIAVYFSVAVMFFDIFPPEIPVVLPLLMSFLGKILGANVMRAYIKFVKGGRA
ncbi:MAG: nucleoside recognition domain-containing protein [Tissierellia bacterium]|nr:nucleoside recognition domain-containing protein [Tissierellia bacterium]